MNHFIKSVFIAFCSVALAGCLPEQSDSLLGHECAELTFYAGKKSQLELDDYETQRVQELLFRIYLRDTKHFGRLASHFQEEIEATKDPLNLEEIYGLKGVTETYKAPFLYFNSSKGVGVHAFACSPKMVDFFDKKEGYHILVNTMIRTGVH